MISAEKLFRERKADFAVCEQSIRQNSKSFYAAFSILPNPKRESIYAIYAFCRAADDSVDIAKNPAALAQIEAQLAMFSDGKVPDLPVWRALQAVFALFDMSVQPYRDMLAGQNLDLHFRQPETVEELEEYCYYVAGSVGVMLLPVLCGDAGHRQALRDAAVSLGVAMQLTNLLRDVGEDFDNGRIYLPKSLMAQHGCSPMLLQTGTVTNAYIAVWEALARRAEALYAVMEKDIFLLDEDSRLPTLSALYLYRDILQQVRRGGYEYRQGRRFVPGDKKGQLLASAQQLLAGGQP